MVDITVRDCLPFPVVGVGAAAGDEQALEAYFAAEPADSGMAYIVIQPRNDDAAGDQAGVTAEYLSRCTPMPVSLMQEGVNLEPNHVYVVPPVSRELQSLKALRR